MRKCLNAAAAAVVFLLATSGSAGELANRLQTTRTMAEAFAHLDGPERSLETLRRLAVFDLVTLADLQLESAVPLELDRADRRALADHWSAFAEVLIGGRFSRQFGFHDAETESAWDDRERGTWRRLDERIDDAHAEALRRAYPHVVSALREQISGLDSAYLISHTFASDAPRTIAKFGLPRFVFTLLRVWVQVRLMPEYSRNAVATTQSLIGLARYLHVSADAAFCASDLVRPPSERRGPNPDPT